MSPMVSVAALALTELFAWAVQETAVAVRVALSQAGGALTVQVVKSAGEGVTVTLPEPPAGGADPEAALRVTEPTAPLCVKVKLLSPIVRVWERLETELLACAVQETAVAVRVVVSQAGGVLTVQVVKSAGVGVTVMEPVAPAAATVAEVGLRESEPVAPDWERVKDLSPMVRVAEREVTELLALAVQLMVLPVVETVSQAGGVLTVQVLKSAGVGVTVMAPVPPGAGAEAEVGLRVREPVAPDWERAKDLSPMMRVAERAVTELLAWAVQLTVLPVVETVSQAGLPVTVQEV